MNVLLIGATGFVGTPLVRTLCHRGDSCTVLSRSGRDPWEDKQVNLVKTDPTVTANWWTFNRMRMRDSRLGLLPRWRTLFGSSTLSYFRPGYSPAEVGSTAQAVAYLAASPAARTAHM